MRWLIIAGKVEVNCEGGCGLFEGVVGCRVEHV